MKLEDQLESMWKERPIEVGAKDVCSADPQMVDVPENPIIVKANDLIEVLEGLRAWLRQFVEEFSQAQQNITNTGSGTWST